MALQCLSPPAEQPNTSSSHDAPWHWAQIIFCYCPLASMLTPGCAPEGLGRSASPGDICECSRGACAVHQPTFLPQLRWVGERLKADCRITFSVLKSLAAFHSVKPLKSRLFTISFPTSPLIWNARKRSTTLSSGYHS